MATSSVSSNVNKYRNDIKSLTVFILAFVVLKVIALGLYLLNILVFSSIAYVLGTLSLIIGIYLVSKQNNEFFPGIKVSVLLVIAMILDLRTALLVSMNPPTLQSSGTFMEQLGQLDATFGNNAYYMAAFTLFTGVFMAVSAYFYNDWFNDNLSSSKPFKSYTYFGVLFFVGEVITFVGYVVLRRADKQILAGWTGASVQSINFSTGIIFVGTIMLVIAFLIEIIAGLQMFSLINKSSRD